MREPGKAHFRWTRPFGWPALLFVFASAGHLAAHPMGNFSINHYTAFEVTGKGVDLRYVLDLAEIPTFAMLRSWNLERTSAKAELEAKARQQAREWMQNLAISSNGGAVIPKFERSELVIADGAGNLPIMRITAWGHVDAPADQLSYEDKNFAERAGWKEIVIRAANGATLLKASQSSNDLSNGLTQYPPDPTVAPPQDVRAELTWNTMAEPVLRAEHVKPLETHPEVSRPLAARRIVAPDIGQKAQVQSPTTQAPVIQAIAQPKLTHEAPNPASMTKNSAPAGAVVKGDFLSRLLHQKALTPWMIFLATCVAFLLGAAHAFTPGHGKTIVAAYLVGSRGTMKHAAFLGAMVTFTHTVSVFALGLATLFLFKYVVPEKITWALGTVSGLSIVAVGGWMLYKRTRAILSERRGGRYAHIDAAHGHSHDHNHEPVGALAYATAGHVQSTDHVHVSAVAHHHDHDHGHVHSHDHGHVHSHNHDSGHVHDQQHDRGHVHSHDHDHGHVHSHGHDGGHHHGPGGHTHMPDEISWGGLMALGASGGLVPCESALLLLLSAIALGRIGLGFLLLVSFSAGLAVVLIAIGVLVLYAKSLLPERNRSNRHPLFRWVPVASAALVTVVGIVLTAVSLGWLQTKWMI